MAQYINGSTDLFFGHRDKNSRQKNPQNSRGKTIKSSSKLNFLAYFGNFVFSYEKSFIQLAIKTQNSRERLKFHGGSSTLGRPNL